MAKLINKFYQCKTCGAKQRAWIGSEAYKLQLCPDCLDKVSPIPDELKQFREKRA